MKKLSQKIARLLIKEGITTYDQTKHVIRLVRREMEITPPKKRSKGTVERLSKEEVERLIEVAYKNNSNHGFMVDLLFQTATRISEFCNLNFEDLYLDERRVIIQTGKGDKRREIPITEHMKRMLQQHARTDNTKSIATGPLFRTTRQTRFSPRRVQQLIKKYAEQAGICQQVTPHTLRHTRATLLIEAGMTKDQVQIFLGHDKPETTEIYTHTARVDLVEALDRATKD